MAIQPFLAMTAAEIQNSAALPQKIAWLSVHFSPYGTGLSNLPKGLPAGSLLILDDSNPMAGHDPERIEEELSGCLASLRCAGLLLDFQQPGIGAQQALAEHLTRSLPCPVAVSEGYAGNLRCPVFLPPLTPSTPLTEHLQPWKRREIWMDISPAGEILKLTESGCEALPADHLPEGGISDTDLHCHYRIETIPEGFQFTLWRTPEDLPALMAEAEAQGVKAFVGLYQEFSSRPEEARIWKQSAG